MRWLRRANWHLCALAFVISAGQAQTEPLAVPTFHNIGLYWKPFDAAADNVCTVEYRPADATTAAFRAAEPLWFDATAHGPDLPAPCEEFQYRGSIVNLRPDTAYEIKLTLASRPDHPVLTRARTRSEHWPEGEAITLAGSSSSTPLVITEGGTPEAYRVYQAGVGGHRIDVAGAGDHCVEVHASYVILRGFTLAGARVHGIRLGAVSDVVIEDCEIFGWGRGWGDGGLGLNLDSAIYSDAPELHRIVIQRNRIRDPRYRSNSWSEHNESGDDHPEGPQAITFKGSRGGHIIRYNDFSMSPAEADSLTGKRYNDVMGETDNFSYHGFPGPDSDIYGNLVAGAWDDGVEAEGGNPNVRIFGNHFTRTFIGIGLATTSLGPVYVYRNVAGLSQRGTSPAHQLQGGSFVKLGTDEFSRGKDRRPFIAGRIVFYHNTVLQPPTNLGGGDATGGYYGIRSSADGKLQYNLIGRNNILESRDGKLSLELRTNPAVPSGHSWDYNLVNAGDPPDSPSTAFPTYVYLRGGDDGVTVVTMEAHGVTGSARYAPTDGDGLSPRLAPGSPGADQGIVLPNFNDEAVGLPDIGAQEGGRPPLVFGPTADWNAQLPESPPSATAR